MVAIMLIVLVLGASGCQRSLFRSSDPRTQFDVHERMRDPYIQLEEPDEFGYKITSVEDYDIVPESEYLVITIR